MLKYEEKLRGYYFKTIPDIKTATIICINEELYESRFDHTLLQAAWLTLEDIGSGGYTATEWVKEIGQRMNNGMTYDEAVNDIP